MSSISAPPGTVTVSVNSAGNFVNNNVVQTGPLTIINSSPASGQLTLIFNSQGNVISSINNYIVISSSNITVDAQNVPVNISASGYGGFIGKTFSGYTGVFIQNIPINVSGAGSLQDDSGWVGRQSWDGGEFINCTSNGPIPSGAGGIVGRYSSSMTCSNCSSSGSIATSAGGILGRDINFSKTGVTTTAINCYSSGNGSSSAGGIFGFGANNGANSSICNAIGCYNTGSIGNDSGGIYGNAANISSTNSRCNATNCYSIGSIGGQAGGIFGFQANSAASGTSTCVAQYCYSAGNISANGGGIFGANAANSGATGCYLLSSSAVFTIFGNSGSGISESECYAVNGSTNWLDTNAASSLNIAGNPGVWTSVASDTPYVLEYFKNSWTNPLPPVPSNNYNTFSVDADYNLSGFYLSTPSGLPAYPDTGLIYNYIFVKKTSTFTGAPGGSGITGFFNGFNYNLGNEFYTSPVTIQNSNPGSGQLTVFLNSYNNVNTFTNNYLILDTDKITFDGQNSQVRINVANYPGLLRKTGTFSNTIVQNVSVNGATFGTLSSGGGWIGQTGWNGGQFISCGASGPVPANGGGIVGSSAANISCTNCSSNGSIAADGGGIVGSSAANISCVNCSSNGAISTNGGGIAGSSAANVSCIGCFQNGTAGTGAGTLFGANIQTGNAAQCFVSNRTLAGSSSTNVTYVNCFGLGITPQGRTAYDLVIDD